MKTIWLSIEDTPRLDHRPILLAVEVRPGVAVVGEAYWRAEAGTWWWANTGPNDYTGESIPEGLIVGSCAMPAPPALKTRDAA
jgi:hypothetical protein